MADDVEEAFADGLGFELLLLLLLLLQAAKAPPAMHASRIQETSF